MTQDDSHQFDLLVGLVQDVFRLWEVISENASDVALREGVDGGPGLAFSYLVDTAVVRLYADPARWGVDYISALPSLRGVDLENDEIFPPSLSDAQPPFGVAASSDLRDAVLEANALLTGEFIFSHQLVGKDNRLLISPEHIPEIMQYVESLEQRSDHTMRSEGAAGDPYGDVRHALNSLRQLNAASKVSPAEVLERTRRLLIRGLAGVSHSDMLAPHRLNRLFEGNLIGNVAGDPAFTSDVIAPPAAEIRWWMDQIRRAKAGNRVQPNPRAVEADAVTLAQLSRLNQERESTNRAFLLITDDRGLHTAYLRWIRMQHDRGRNEFFALRYSRQYIPILNIKDMGGAYQEGQIFTEIIDAVSGFVANFYSRDIEDSWWADVRHRTPPRAMLRRALLSQLSKHADEVEPYLADINEQVRQIVSLWASALTYAATAKADTIQELMAAEFDYWKGILAGPAMQKAFSEQVRRLARGFEDLSDISTLLRQEIRALESVPAGSAGAATVDLHGRRDVISEFRGFSSELFRGKSIAEAVSDLRGPEVAAELARTARDERMLVMGALCLHIGAWTAAETVLGQAGVAASRPRADRHPQLATEISFLSCVARRLAADARSWRSEYAAAERDLEALLAAAPEGSLESIRVQGELLALHLCAVAWIPNDREEAGGHLRRASRAWLDLVQIGGRDAMQREPGGPWDSVRLQFDLNTMVLAFWSHVLDRALDPRLRTAATEALGEFRAASAVSPTADLHGSIYPDLAEYALQDEPSASLVDRISSTIDTILARDRTSGFAFDIPSVDRQEYLEVKRALQPPVLA